jgi:hypothetical protein
MGYIKHNALIIQILYSAPTWDVYTEILRACSEANIEVSRILTTTVNVDNFVFVCPDGSKEGRETSDEGDKFRSTLYERVTSKYPESIEIHDVRFGGDDEFFDVKQYSPWSDD